MVTGCCCCWHPWVVLQVLFVKYCFISLSWLENQTSCQKKPVSSLRLRKVRRRYIWALLRNLLYFLFPPRSPLNIVVAGFLRFVWGKCLDCTFAGWHSVFYELCKDIETADTSIWWCELSAAVIELLHLSQGRGEAWPRATVEFSDPAPHASYGTQLLKEAVRFLLVSPLISALTVLMGYNWISNAVGSGCGSHWL